MCARDVYRLCAWFRDTAAEKLAAYGLLERLLADQCEVVAENQSPQPEEDDVGEGDVPVQLKAAKQVSSASLQSPHDPDATYSGHKGKGYEVQVAETCHQDNLVEVITHVEVTDSCVSDARVTVPILEALAARELQPEELVADTSYGSGDNAVEAERRGCELVSPVCGPTATVAVEMSVAGAMRPDDFQVDPRPEEPAGCPAGHFSTAQVPCPAHARHLEVSFDRSTCEPCPLFHRCPARLNQAADGYAVTVDLTAANLERRRRAQASGQFQERYAVRAGIEATNSELKRGHGLDELRVRGRPRIELVVYLKALACNCKRMVRAFLSEMSPVIPARA